MKAKVCEGQKPLAVSVPPVDFAQWPDAAKQYRFANICQWASQCDPDALAEMSCPGE